MEAEEEKEGWERRYEGVDLLPRVLPTPLTSNANRRTPSLDRRACSAVQSRRRLTGQLRLNDRFDLSTTLDRFHPTCFSTTSNKHKLTSLANDGWREWAWQEKRYWVANVTGSTVSFELPVVFGVVNVMYQRSGEYGLGDAACWIEGEHEQDTRTVIKGYWTNPWNVLQ